MKIKMLSAAVAASVVASQGFALSIVTNPVPDVELGFSGATAVDKQFQSYIAQTCNAGTLDVYTQDADDASAFYCVVDKSITGTANDQKVLFRKASGGSSEGVTPVGAGLAVNAIDLSTCSINDDASTTDRVEWNCADSLVTTPSEVGISDVEPALFTLSQNQKPVLGAEDLFGNKPVIGTEGGPDISALSVFPANTQTFGIVVSPGLRDALQGAQGLTVGSDEVNQMPSMSSALIANIMAGNVESWNELKDSAGNSIVAGVGDASVNVCLRRPGSGTQAQANSFYMGLGCALRGADDLSYAGLIPAVDPDGQGKNGYEIQQTQGFFGPINVPAPYVFWNDGSSDMGKCVSQISRGEKWSLQDGGDSKVEGDYDVTVIRGGQTGWAIGVQSVEKVKESKLDRNEFKYVAINGVAPTLENVAAGLYHNVASASIQWNTAILTDAAKLALANRFVTLAQGASTIAGANADLKASTATPQFYINGVQANTGSLAFAQGSVTTTGPLDVNSPAIPFNKGLVGPSTCAVPVVSGTAFDVAQKN